MIYDEELPNYGRVSGTLHIDSARRARRMQTQAGVAETLKLPPDKRRARDQVSPSDPV